MKRPLTLLSLALFIGLALVNTTAFSQNTAASRAASLGKGMNLSVWLENEYYFNSTTTFPDVTRYSESDIANLKSLGFQSVRLPVIFEGFASPTAPYAFDLNNANVVKGLNYVDSAIQWCSAHNMILVIDNHLADDNGSMDQTNYQITDANYTTQASLISAVWRQIIARYEYTDPNKVIFELRNEPNSVSDANLRTVYQTVIDTVRKYDHTHTLVVGNTGYYDPIALSQSTPYSDTNIIYTVHIYDGNGFYGFCEQGTGGVASTDSVAGTHISFPKSGEIAELHTEMQAAHNWGVTNHVPVWLGEFGCTTLPEVYRDDTSRCNYIHAMGTEIDNAGMPWAYWDGYGPTDYVSGYGNPTPLYYGFSMFDRSDILTLPHLNTCFTSALHLGISGINHISAASDGVLLYPNPTSDNITLKIEQVNGNVEIVIMDMSGQKVYNATSISYGELNQQINLASCTAGMYIAEIRSGDEVVRKKFILAR